jgi:hypothetical protein
VTGVALPGHGISNSSVFASVCALGTLLSIDLSRNSLADLGDRFVLGTSPCSVQARSLNLSSNRLAASLGGLSGFPRMEFLDMLFNRVSGNLSAELGRFPRLRSLNLCINGLEL